MPDHPDNDTDFIVLTVGQATPLYEHNKPDEVSKKKLPRIGFEHPRKLGKPRRRNTSRRNPRKPPTN